MTRLTLRQRYQIEANFQNGKTCAQMGKVAKVAASTVSREIGRRGAPGAFRKRAAALRAGQEVPPGLYCAETAHKAAADQRKGVGGRRVVLTKEQEAFMVAHLRIGWSPEQVAAVMPRHADGSAPCSHVWIYDHIRRDRAAKGDLHTFLRRRGKGPRPPGDGRGRIPGRTPIGERPAEAETREVAGHWEADTVRSRVGARAAVVSAVCRCSRLSLFRLVPSASAAAVGAALADMLADQPVRSLTVDNGKEFAGHQDVAAAIGGPVFFADPYSSYQRGSGEHANLLLRGFFPKGTDFSEVSAEALQWAEDLINDRPMKHHGWETRRQVHARALAALRAPATGLPAAA